MAHGTIRQLVCGGLLAAAAMSVAMARTAATPELETPVTLGVPGQVNGAVGLASRGDLVVAVWRATVRPAGGPGGAGNHLFLAVSADGGRTFGAASQINTDDGFAAVGGEQLPRPIIVSASELLVVWRSAEGDADVIQVSHSVDGGATFGAPVAMHDPALSGYQGFHSAALGPDDVLHVTLAFARETDGVLGSPVRVSEDGRVLNGCPDDGAAMAVDPTGAAHLVWPTVADVPDPAKTIFYARSDDGGTFSRRIQLPRSGATR